MTEIEARFKEMEEQRNAALNRAVVLFGVIASLEEKVKQLELKIVQQAQTTAEG